MSVRFQKTPRGEVAILPRKDYELLVARASEADEDAGTARIVTRARKEIGSGGLLLPKDIVDRMASGENPVRVLREWRERQLPGGMTQMHLSYKTNLSQGYISDIENGRRTGTAAALRLIANALNVPLDLLVKDA
ncbi:helix-turn-helix domain-containing protein [Bradyrhizobium sp.]|jgi:ribosome-binding protein aMBF1 (putative translation factor)|uniref:helix-turn-helix domain-containing protein n=1 Tax=Bradyrhizobium sp. TaxID=376 RepID=UPI003C72F612